MLKNISEASKFIRVAISGSNVGAVSQSSNELVRHVLRYVPNDCKVILEYGAGSGAVTRALIAKLHATGRLYAIEPNPQFVDMLRAIGDERLIVIEGHLPAALKGDHLELVESVDIILSSVPFSFLSLDERKVLVSESYDRLKAGGSLIVFHQYIPLAKRLLQLRFGSVTSIFEWQNLFPCYIFISRK